MPRAMCVSRNPAACRARLHIIPIAAETLASLYQKSKCKDFVSSRLNGFLYIITPQPFPASRPGSQAASQPASQPPEQPGSSQPANQPASQPASQEASLERTGNQQPSKASSKPTIDCLRRNSLIKQISVQSSSKTAHNPAQIAKVEQPITSYSGEQNLPRAACVKGSGGLSSAFAHNSYCCGDLGPVVSRIERQRFCELMAERVSVCGIKNLRILKTSTLEQQKYRNKL